MESIHRILEVVEEIKKISAEEELNLEEIEKIEAYVSNICSQFSGLISSQSSSHSN